MKYSLCGLSGCNVEMSALLLLLYVLALHLLTCADVHGIKNSERGDSHGIEKVVKYYFSGQIYILREY